MEYMEDGKKNNKSLLSNHHTIVDFFQIELTDVKNNDIMKADIFQKNDRKKA